MLSMVSVILFPPPILRMLKKLLQSAPNIVCRFIEFIIHLQDMTLKEAETVALSILKQVMEEKVISPPLCFAF